MTTSTCNLIDELESYRSNIIAENNLDTSEILSPKSVVFVAHEFGLYPGNGGIASYLNQITLWLIKNTNFRITIIVYGECGLSEAHKSCDRFRLIHIKPRDLNKDRVKIAKILSSISADYVETADYLGLAALYYQQTLPNTVCVTNHHTATKECFEWSNGRSFSSADTGLQEISNFEILQFQNSDYNIAPSNFLASYVQKAYGLSHRPILFFNPFYDQLLTKSECRQIYSDRVDLEEFDGTFNIVLITRFEGRKNQLRLVRAINNMVDCGYNNIHCILAGNSSVDSFGRDYRSLVMDCIEETNPNNFSVFDFLSREEQEKFVSFTDLTVMPSTYENCPLAMIESVKRGIPVLGSVTSGIADYSDECMLFNPDDEQDLPKKLIDFYQMTPEERNLVAYNQRKKLEIISDPMIAIVPRFNLPKVKP